MAKDKPTDVDLPSADAPDAPAAAPATPATPATPAAPAASDPPKAETPIGEQSLPLFLVSARGLDSKSIHASDETEAVNLFYKAHQVTNPENYNHRVEKVS